MWVSCSPPIARVKRRLVVNLVDVDTTSAKIITNRCWTRAMGGEQETHIGNCSLIQLDQGKDDLQRNLTILNTVLLLP